MRPLTVRIEVHLHADLVRLAPADRGVLRFELPEGVRVADVLHRIALEPDRRVIVGVNGESAPLDQLLDDGARIDILPPMSGGTS